MSSDSDSQSSSRQRRGQLSVVTSKGVRQRFLRGMITHDLVQRGLSFDDSYAVARAVRDQLSNREEVTTAEIRELIQRQLERLFGSSLPESLRGVPPPAPRLHVMYQEQRQPYSRGVLARSVLAAGVGIDRAYRIATELEAALYEEGVDALPSSEIARRVAELIERLEGPEAAGRYRLVRRIHRLPRPLVLFVGGASGTGKSTLSLELAPLLRIYRINSTDTIRQVMRMVFSPAILPALHTSSFELPPSYHLGSGEEWALIAESEGAPRVTAAFEEQALRVSVGVRAVVERAIAENMSIVVEGVHLYPPLVPFADLEGAAYQVPLVLMSLDAEVHRSRFLTRARLGGRRAERYVEHFSAIRTIHEFLVQQAEHHDVPLVDTSSGEPAAQRTLRLVTGMLQQNVPSLAEAAGPEGEERIPTLLLIIDGLADRPVRALGGRTPLQAAHTPTLDRLAREGRCGLADPVAPGVVPDTAAGTLALFGQSPLAMKRGPVEALGAGLHLSPGDVALRGNFATLDDNGQVIDRRAGRIRVGARKLAQTLDRLPLPGSMADEVEVRVRTTTEHRLAIALRGEGLSSAIQGSDPGEGAPPGPPLTPRPFDPDDEAAVYSARVLAVFEEEARRVLADDPVNLSRRDKGLPPANAILTRGAGRIHRLLSLEQAGFPLRLTCISGDRTILGIAGWLGADIVTNKRMTANLDTDLGVKFTAAREALGRSDLVILHLKGADIAAHDQRPDLKVEFLEKVDQCLAQLLGSRAAPLRIAVGGDHATLSESGQHAADPLPVLIWGSGIDPDSVESFDETAVTGGELHRFPLQLLLGRVFRLA